MNRSRQSLRFRLARFLFYLVTIAGICLLGVILMVHRASKDTTPPYILCPQEETEYTLGEDTAMLLWGIMATDPEDGDVTASIRVRNISVAADQSSAIVTYVARDQSNNIGMEKRFIKVKKAGEDTEADIPTDSPDDSTMIHQEDSQADNPAEMEGTP